MSKRSTALTAAAGEHYVAYKLSSLGYLVALTRGGSPVVDLMVGDVKGNAAVSIQVKTSSNAWNGAQKKPENSRWLWDVGDRAIGLEGENIFYAFVDLRGGLTPPDVFIVPSKSVSDFVKPEHSRKMFPLCKTDGENLKENWQLITDRLESTKPSARATA